MSAKQAAERAKAWCVTHALPLWAARGWHPRHGGFVEKLDLHGAPMLDAARRVRVQARQIYCFAHAGALGWDAGGAKRAMDGFDWFVERCWSPDGEPGWVHLLEADGSVRDARRDAYDHAFALLACAWAYRVSGDEQVLGIAQRTANYMDEAMASPHGGWLEGVPHQAPRRQNPHMHGFEAALALFEASGDAQWLERAKTIYGLFEAHFIDHETGALYEYFDDDWRRREAPFEPGHQMEWVWLLGAFERIAGVDAASHRAALARFGMAGQDPESGFLWDAIDAKGACVSPTRRCWPQTELLKAHLARAELDGEPLAGEIARVIDALLDTYLADAPAGGWMDSYDADGQPAAKDIPASTFYHLFCAIAEADRVTNP